MAAGSPHDRAAAAFRRGGVGALDAASAARMAAASGDLALVLDQNGVICDVAVTHPDLRDAGVESWLDKRLSDTVALDSRPKVELLLKAASAKGDVRWREINHPTPKGDNLPVRYVAVSAGDNGQIIVIGRDHRDANVMQQRLLQAQQALERDYARLRDTETRYRALFQMAAEPVLVVEAASRRIVEANPAADKLLGAQGALVGKPFARAFAVQSQEAAAALVSVAQAGAARQAAKARLTANGRHFLASASLFRQNRAEHCLVRLEPADRQDAEAAEAGQRLLAVLERLPDAFVVTDDAFAILAHNDAFLDLARIASAEQARGLILSGMVGRPGIDWAVLMDALETAGVASNFSTVLRSAYGDQEDVEIAAVAAEENGRAIYGFSIRSVTRREAEQPRANGDLPRSAADMSQLVGRVSMKEIVRDTTDLVERLCIEAALDLTSNNRASAAELLGLSRQSLYSKLHRFGMANTDDAAMD